jgi:hypothetical protein
MTRRADRYLCPTCLELQPVKASEPSSASVTLGCGHQRPFALLPSQGVSVEHLDTPLGERLFPVVTFVPSTAPTNADAAEGVDAGDAEDHEEVLSDVAQ